MKRFYSQYIVRILDFLETEHNYYIIEEYCNGADLKTAIKQQKRFS
jgi:serine/threonine protein kinase